MATGPRISEHKAQAEQTKSMLPEATTSAQKDWSLPRVLTCLSVVTALAVSLPYMLLPDALLTLPLAKGDEYDVCVDWSWRVPENVVVSATGFCFFFGVWAPFLLRAIVWWSVRSLAVIVAIVAIGVEAIDDNRAFTLIFFGGLVVAVGAYIGAMIDERTELRRPESMSHSNSPPGYAQLPERH